jgi:hypothetical protein
VDTVELIDDVPHPALLHLENFYCHRSSRRLDQGLETLVEKGSLQALHHLQRAPCAKGDRIGPVSDTIRCPKSVYKFGTHREGPCRFVPSPR